MATIPTLAPPFASDPGNAPTPMEGMLGHTTPAEVLDQVPPRANQLPLGASGRANFYGLPQPDELNRELIGQKGLLKFDTMYRTDGHIRRMVLMAWSPIAGGQWSLEPYGGDNATDTDRTVAETIWWGLTEYMSPNFFEHLQTLGPVLLRSGFTPFEGVWATTTRNGKQLILPRKLDLRLPRSVWRMWQDDYGDLTFIGQILPNKPDVVIPASELVFYRLGAEGDNWTGTSLLRYAYKHWFYKDKLERLDAIGQERKAVGVPIVYPPAGAADVTKQEVEAVLAALHVNETGYLIMPGPKQGAGVDPNTGWVVDIITFDSSSGSGIQESLTYHQTAIASSFVQDFMQLGQHAVGARATAEVQEDPAMAAVQALGEHITPPLQRLINRVYAVNWGADGHAPKLKLSLTDNASLSELSTYIQQLVASEVIVPDEELEDYARQRADLPPANADMRKAKTAARLAGLEQAANPPDPVDPANPNPNAPPAKPSPGPPKPAAPKKQLDAPVSASRFEKLISLGRLKDAFDGARQGVENAAGEQALITARQHAYAAAQGQPLPDKPTPALVDAIHGEYQRLHGVGYATVTDELGRQRRALAAKGRHLDDQSPSSAAAAGGRLVKARTRAEHSADNVVHEINKRLRQGVTTGLKDPRELQAAAEKAATGQMHVEAMENAQAQVNDGRADAAMEDPATIGAYYTSVLDGNTCDECAASDDDRLLTPDEALLLGPPNPECAGGDKCRCILVWVLSDDPAAVASVTG